jgi:hypothetical protein
VDLEGCIRVNGGSGLNVNCTTYRLRVSLRIKSAAGVYVLSYFWRLTRAGSAAGASKVYGHVGQSIEGVGNGKSSTVHESKLPLNMPLNCLKAPIAVDPSRGISEPSLLCHSSDGCSQRTHWWSLVLARTATFCQALLSQMRRQLDSSRRRRCGASWRPPSHSDLQRQIRVYGACVRI